MDLSAVPNWARVGYLVLLALVFLARHSLVSVLHAVFVCALILASPLVVTLPAFRAPTATAQKKRSRAQQPRVTEEDETLAKLNLLQGRQDQLDHALGSLTVWVQFGRAPALVFTCLEPPQVTKQTDNHEARTIKMTLHTREPKCGAATLALAVRGALMTSGKLRAELNSLVYEVDLVSHLVTADGQPQPDIQVRLSLSPFSFFLFAFLGFGADPKRRRHPHQRNESLRRLGASPQTPSFVCLSLSCSLLLSSRLCVCHFCRVLGRSKNKQGSRQAGQQSRERALVYVVGLGSSRPSAHAGPP